MEASPVKFVSIFLFLLDFWLLLFCHDSPQLSLRRGLKSDVLLKPGASIFWWPPYFIHPAIFNLGHVTNDCMLWIERLDIVATVLIVLLNLPVLVCIKVHEIINDIAPLAVVLVPREYFVWPLRCIDDLSVKDKAISRRRLTTTCWLIWITIFSSDVL